MLHCPINLTTLTSEQLECATCTICKARSKLNYPFARNLTTSEDLVNALKNFIEINNFSLKCFEPEIVKNPDLRVLNIKQGNRLVCRVEAKFLDGFAFMMAETYLGDHLKPKETLVVDEPKLLSYFECKASDFEEQGRDIPIFVVWQFNRPCADLGGITVFQEVSILKAIYDARGDKRAFERRTVQSDMVAGKKRGITSKYHFSLKECRPVEELMLAINSIN